MGVAAYNRASRVIGQRIAQKFDESEKVQALIRAESIAMDCDEFVRQAMALMTEPTGLRKRTVETMKTRRGYPKRHEALVSAHNAWVDSPNDTTTRAILSITRAQAAYSLLVYCLGCWEIPDSIAVPRAAKQ